MATAVRTFPGPDANLAVPARLQLPDVTGLPAAEAVARLREAGLDATQKKEPGRSPVRSGVVVKQDPKPGTTVRSGSTVKLQVSS